MPIYAFVCDECGATIQLMRPISERRKRTECGACGHKMRRFLRAEHVGSPNQDWRQEVLCDSMGVAPSQVDEHRRAHPNIPMNDEGQIVIRNGAEEKRITSELRRALNLT